MKWALIETDTRKIIKTADTEATILEWAIEHTYGYTLPPSYSPGDSYPGELFLYEGFTVDTVEDTETGEEDES